MKSNYNYANLPFITILNSTWSFHFTLYNSSTSWDIGIEIYTNSCLKYVISCLKMVDIRIYLFKLPDIEYVGLGA